MHAFFAVESFTLLENLRFQIAFVDCPLLCLKLKTEEYIDAAFDCWAGDITSIPFVSDLIKDRINDMIHYGRNHDMI